MIERDYLYCFSRSTFPSIPLSSFFYKDLNGNLSYYRDVWYIVYLFLITQEHLHLEQQAQA